MCMYSAKRESSASTIYAHVQCKLLSLLTYMYLSLLVKTFVCHHLATKVYRQIAGYQSGMCDHRVGQ